MFIIDDISIIGFLIGINFRVIFGIGFWEDFVSIGF